MQNSIPSHVVTWWDAVAGHALLMGDQAKMEQGRIAELMTIDYGRQGSNAIGIDKEPEWPSFDDNSAGYDVLSYDHGASGLQNLMIEVKSTSVSPIQFYLTRNEWNQAEKKGDAYIFHVWDMKNDPLALHVLTVAEVAPHIPSDNGKGKWSNLVVSIGGG
jgi:hypothetical protein